MTDATMTPEAATALRRPFPAESVGKLPKPLKGRDDDKGKCQPGSRYSADNHYCGGWHARAMHLDFVGHAATTDRLLTVDPEWTWEPFALDANGLPAFDANRNLWIRLTVCGITRIGVGDGSSPKECIGDAIRNAAMRFGVALDLWAKEALVEFAQAAQAHMTEPVSPADPVQTERATARKESRAQAGKPDTGEAMKANTRGRLFVLLGEAPGIGDDETRHKQFLADTIPGRTDTDSRATLTEAEAQTAIARLVAWQKGEPGAAWSPTEGDR